jgi:fumarate reductase subunit D
MIHFSIRTSRPVWWALILGGGMWARIMVQIRVSAQIGALGTMLSKRDWVNVVLLFIHEQFWFCN